MWREGALPMETPGNTSGRWATAEPAWVPTCHALECERLGHPAMPGLTPVLLAHPFPLLTASVGCPGDSVGRDGQRYRVYVGGWGAQGSPGKQSQEEMDM